MNSLQLTLEVLLHRYPDFSDEKRLEFIHRAMGQVNRQHRLLSYMKEFSHTRVEAILPISPENFWKDVLRFIRSRLTHTSIEVRPVGENPFQPSRTSPQPAMFSQNKRYMLRIDHRAAMDALGRVVDNAMDALEGVPDPNIYVVGVLEKSRMILRIRDNGPGISPEIRSSLFLPFVTTRFDRIGFGLSIARKLMTQMGGDISIDSTLSGGTSVTLDFPVEETSGVQYAEMF